MTFLEHLSQSDETRMIREVAEKWTADISDADVRAAKGFARARWTEMAEMPSEFWISNDDTDGDGVADTEIFSVHRSAQSPSSHPNSVKIV